MSILVDLEAVVIGGSGGALLGSWILYGHRNARREPRPRCAHCRRRIRSGLQLTDTHGRVTVHWHGDQRACRTAAESVEREARHFASSTPRDHCPICGQHDPDALTPSWGGWQAHESCVDWLGKEPNITRARVDQDRRIWDLAKRQERQAQAEAELRVRLCEHAHTEEIYTYGAGRSLLCRDCGGRADLGKPQPPPGPGAGSRIRR